MWTFLLLAVEHDVSARGRHLAPGAWLAEPSSEQGVDVPSGMGQLTALVSGHATRTIANVVGTLLLLRLIGPEQFGIGIVSLLLVNFALFFRDFALTNGILNRVTLTQLETSTMFWVAQLVGIGGVLLSAISGGIAVVLGARSLAVGLLVAGLGFPLASISAVHDALLRRALRIRESAMIDAAAVILGVGVAVLLAIGGAGWGALIAQRLVQLGSGSALRLLVCSWRPDREISGAAVNRLIGFGAHASSANLLAYGARNIDNLLISAILGSQQLGLYAKAYDLLLGQIAQVAGPVGHVVQPVLARMRSAPSTFDHTIRVLAAASGLALVPSGVILLVHPALVTVTVLGEDWADAESVVRWLGVGLCYQLLGPLMVWILASQGMGRQMTQAAIIGSVLTTAGFAMTVPLGIAWMAASFVLIGLCVQLPLLIGLATGPRSLASRRSLLMALLLPVIALVVVALVNAAVRAIWRPDGSSWAWLGALVLVSYGVIAGLLVTTRKGRGVVMGIRDVVSSLSGTQRHQF